MEKVIFSNFYEDVLSLEEDIKKNASEYFEDMTEDEITEEMISEKADHVIELKHSKALKKLSIKTDGRILVIGDIGTWRGRFSGYKILDNNLKNILYSDSYYYKVYMEKGNVKAEAIHHDNRNYLEFREIREDRNIDNLLSDLYGQKEVSRSKINYYTKSIASKVKEAIDVVIED